MALEPVRQEHAPALRGRQTDASYPLTRDDVLTAREAAELLRCSTRHVYMLAERGELPGARRLGRKLLISRHVLEAWLLDC